MKKTLLFFIVISLTVVNELYAQQPATLVHPKNNSITSNDIIDLLWDPEQDAVVYQLEVSTDSSFNNIIVQANIPINSYEFSLPPSNQEFFWRIRYNNNTNWSTWSGFYKFLKFSPKELVGLKLWLSGDNNISIDQNNRVNSWGDQSNDQNNATQNTIANKPLYIPSIDLLNSKPAIYFDGQAMPNHDNLVLSQNLSISKVHIFALGKKDNSTDNYFLFGQIPASVYLGNLSSGATVMRLGSGAMSSGMSTGHILEHTIQNYVYDGSQFKVSFNGVLKGTNNLTGSSIFNVIGMRNASDPPLKGHISEIILYDTVLTNAQVDLIEGYLRYKYAPPVNLGANIITCTFPVTLTAGDRFKTYSWSTPDTTHSISVNSAGIYTVTTVDVFGFTSSDTIEVIFDTINYTAKPGFDSTICLGDTLILPAGPRHLSYLWSTNDTINAIEVNTPGTYIVQRTDCNNNIVIDTFNITVQSPVFSLGNDTTLCYPSSITYDPGLSTAYNYSWSSGDTSSTLAMSVPDTLSLLITDNLGCSHADSVIIQVDSFAANISLGADTTLCNGQFIGLQTGDDLAMTYSWSTNATSAIIPVTSAGQYSLTVTDSIGCAASDTIIVSLAGNPPVASFNFTDICFGDTVHFTNTSTIPPGSTIISYSWDFGDTSASLLQHPSHYYSQSGIYPVILTIESDIGCVDSDTQMVSVNPNPIVDFTWTGHCTGNQTLFMNYSYVPGGFASSTKWHLGDGDSSVANNPSYFYQSGGTYIVDLTITSDKGCITTGSDTIEIHQGPTSSYTYTTACINMPLQFNSTSTPGGAPISSWFWNFGNGTTSFAQNTTQTFNQPGIYNVQHIVTDTNNCQSQLSIPVTVYSNPVADFSKDTTCPFVPLQLQDNSIGSGMTIDKWQWKMQDVTEDTLQHPTFVFEENGNYPVTLVITTDLGCKDSVTRNITVTDPPVAGFSFSPEFGAAPLNVDLTNQSTGGDTYEWFINGVLESTEASPLYQFEEDGYYTIQLVTTNKYGCSDTIEKTINVAIPVLDLTIQDLIIVQDIQNDGNIRIKVHATLRNSGSRKITGADLILSLNGGSTIVEQWEGVLDINEETVYTFKSEFLIQDIEKQAFLCLEANKINNEEDDNPADNIMCRPLSEIFKILQPFPNPADDVVNIDIILPKSEEILIEAYNALGQKVIVLYNGALPKGLTQLDMPVSRLSMGIYYLRISYREENELRKIVIQR